MDIWCFVKDKLPIQWPDPLETVPESAFLWIDCTPKELDEALALLRQLENIEIHGRHVDDCLNPQHPCSFESMKDYYLLIFRSWIEIDSNYQSIETLPIAFIATERILLTVNHNDQILAHVKRRFAEAKRPHALSANLLIYIILNQVVDNFLTLRVPLASQFEAWEALLLNEKRNFSQWSEFLAYKSNLRQLRTLCEEQEDTVGLWRDDLDTQLNEQMAVRLNDLADHIHRSLRHTQRLESDVDSLMQLHYFVVGQRTNEIIQLLTVISGIFLPMGLITGIFGMNFHHMDILQSSAGFPLSLILMGVIAVTMLVFFRWKKWI